MTEAELTLARIESIVAEIERLDAASGGQFRQPSDREALNRVGRIERKMAATIATARRETR